MGLIRAFSGAVGGSLADQWKDFLTVPAGILPTAALFPAVPVGTNAGRGSNTKLSEAVITNGSKIVVPEGYGLLTLQDGELTGFSAEPGGYIWDSSDLNSRSVFAGDGFVDPLVVQSWERFKFGGRPSGQQICLYVCLKELPNNKFGTQSEVYWDDDYLNAQVGAVTRGAYTLKIVDPIVFVMRFVPSTYLQGLDVFDFTDPANPAGAQVFSEVVASLAPAFSSYANDANKGHRIAQIQQDSVGFAESLAQVVNENYQWETTRGLLLGKVALVAVEYDDASRVLLKTVQRADALAGARGNSNLQASVAAGMQAAGETGGTAGILGMGIAGASVGLTSLQQSGDPKESRSAGDEGMLSRLGQLKDAFDSGLITQAEYDAARAKALGI